MYTAGTLILCVNTWFSIVEHALSPITHCLLLIRDVTNIINYKCLSKKKLAKFRQFYVFGMFSIISFRTLSEYMPSYVFFKFREDGYPGFERDADVLIHL